MAGGVPAAGVPAGGAATGQQQPLLHSAERAGGWGECGCACRSSPGGGVAREGRPTPTMGSRVGAENVAGTLLLLGQRVMLPLCLACPGPRHVCSCIRQCRSKKRQTGRRKDSSGRAALIKAEIQQLAVAHKKPNPQLLPPRNSLVGREGREVRGRGAQ